jgi:hypothetical protein
MFFAKSLQALWYANIPVPRQYWSAFEINNIQIGRAVCNTDGIQPSQNIGEGQHVVLLVCSCVPYGFSRLSEITWNVAPELSPRKGNAPVAISHKTTPNENKSVRASCSLPSTCSGDIHATVQGVLPALVSSSALTPQPGISSDSCRRSQPAACGGCFSQAEIQNFAVATPRYKQIRGLDVSMNDTFGMRGIWCVSNVDGMATMRSKSRVRADIKYFAVTPLLALELDLRRNGGEKRRHRSCLY